MEKIIFATPEALKARIGEEIYVDDWQDVPQPRVDAFAHSSGDVSWIHIDVERARRESPYGSTIAHGMLTLTIASYSINRVFYPWSKSGAYYGIDRVRFIAPVPVGSRVRTRGLLRDVTAVDKGLRIGWRLTVEREGSDKPVCIADILSMQFL
jgi:acyl dehydratase